MNRKVGIGCAYDLSSLFNRMNRLYFDSSLNLEVKWSTRSVPKASRSVQLGTFCDKTKTITMSKRLDNPDVPLFFVEHVLFHEMLHAVFPSERHRMHTAKFKRFEKMHPDYDRAIEWEKKNMKVLFRSAQNKLPFEETA
jgi:hypothetical protein